MSQRPRPSLVAGLAAALLLTAWSAAVRAGSGPPPLPRYVDTSAYLTRDADIDAWYELTHGLKHGFDQICGDTFCEGEFTNIQSLRFRCSVRRTTGEIGVCAWMFAASEEEIEPRTGRILVRKGFWRCLAPLAPHTTIEELLAALQGPSPLYAALPRSTVSLMDGLIDCL